MSVIFFFFLFSFKKWKANKKKVLRWQKIIFQIHLKIVFFLFIKSFNTNHYNSTNFVNMTKSLNMTQYTKINLFKHLKIISNLSLKRFVLVHLRVYWFVLRYTFFLFIIKSAKMFISLMLQSEHIPKQYNNTKNNLITWERYFINFGFYRTYKVKIVFFYF